MSSCQLPDHLLVQTDDSLHMPLPKICGAPVVPGGSTRLHLRLFFSRKSPLCCWGGPQSLFFAADSYPETCGLQIRLTEHLWGVKPWGRQSSHKAGTNVPPREREVRLSRAAHTGSARGWRDTCPELHPSCPHEKSPASLAQAACPGLWGHLRGEGMSHG